MKRLVIVGATGMVGGHALRYALEHPSVDRVISIGRKNLGISHPKLKEVLHSNFADCSALAAVLSGQDTAVFCLGTYTGAMPDAEFRKITVDYTIEFARVLHYRLLRAIYPVFRLLFPNFVIRSDDLARAMIDVTVRGTQERGGVIFENRDIRTIVKLQAGVS